MGVELPSLITPRLILRPFEAADRPGVERLAVPGKLPTLLSIDGDGSRKLRSTEFLPKDGLQRRATLSARNRMSTCLPRS